MTFRNEMSGTEYETREELVEDLINNFVNIQREKYLVNSAEVQLIAELHRLSEELTNNGESDTKVTVLKGTTQAVKITPRTNVTYDKTEDGDNILESLFSKYPQHMETLVRRDYKERKTAVDKFIDEHTEIRPESTESVIAQELCEHRKTKNGKPNIKVESL
jgi:chaperonin GroEL (HSP60 family)